MFCLNYVWRKSFRTNIIAELIFTSDCLQYNSRELNLTILLKNRETMKIFTNKKFYAPDESFDYSVITLCQETLTVLNEEERSFLRKLGLKF